MVTSNEVKKIFEKYPKIWSKLEKENITTKEELMKYDPKELSKKLGVGVGVAKNLLSHAEDIDGLKVAVTRISDESLQYVERIKNEELRPAFISYPLNSLVNEFDKGYILVNHKYQRKPGQWNDYLNQLFLFTLFERAVVPPLVIADLRFISPEKRAHELIDGQQRYHLMKRWLTDDIKLPKYIPEDLGGGKVRSECPPETLELIDRYLVWVMQITPKNEDQIYKIYNRIQKGARFTFGQDIRGHQGTFKELVVELSKHPFISHLAKREEDWELQSAGYLYMSILYEEGISDVKSFQRDRLIQYLEEHADDEIPDFIYDNCLERADMLQKIFEEHEMDKIVNLQLISLSRCLNKAFQEYPKDTYLKAMGEAFEEYVTKLKECEIFLKLEKKPDSPFTEEYVEQIKLSPYYPVAIERKDISTKGISNHSELIWCEFERIMAAQ